MSSCSKVALTAWLTFVQERGEGRFRAQSGRLFELSHI